jgi:acetylornithine/N-succinyldiaminopimelate aminotransferase
MEVKNMDNQAWIKKGEKYLIRNYNRLPFCLVKGSGSYVYDAEGKAYLDFVGGIAVNALGHGHETLVKSIQEQAEKMLHASNLYWLEAQIELAELLIENSPFEQAFFCNSGTEANEAAIKLARKYSKMHYGEGRYKIITLENSFHGRTMGALGATGQSKLQESFLPMVPGFLYVKANDIDALKEKLDKEICAIMLEPIMGEGGVLPLSQDYLQTVKAICEEKDILLIFDEVQCGMGRTGQLFAFQETGVVPDIITLAKGLGGGVPIGAMLVNEKTKNGFVPGDHGTTFGGNPLATKAASTVVKILLESGFLQGVAEKGEYLQQELKLLQEKYSFIKDVRGKGLMIGVELEIPGKDIVAGCLEKGLLINCTHDTVLRFVPALNIIKEDLEKGLDILKQVLAQQ